LRYPQVNEKFGVWPFLSAAAVAVIAFQAEALDLQCSDFKSVDRNGKEVRNEAATLQLSADGDRWTIRYTLVDGSLANRLDQYAAKRLPPDKIARINEEGGPYLNIIAGWWGIHRNRDLTITGVISKIDEDNYVYIEWLYKKEELKKFLTTTATCMRVDPTRNPSSAAISSGSPRSAAESPKAGKTDSSAKPLAPQMDTSRNSTIALENEGGTFVVPVVINGELTLKFTIDSGASDVSIPADVVMTLLRTGTLNHDDFLGTKTYRLADGSSVPSQTFRIRSLKVGDHVLKDVTGSTAPVAGTLLLGQSFLSRFRSWSIDNQRRVLLLDQ
jgi:predicted aspartyl protease